MSYKRDDLVMAIPCGDKHDNRIYRVLYADERSVTITDGIGSDRWSIRDVVPAPALRALASVAE